MSKSTKTEQEDRGTSDSLPAVIRAGARKLMADALEAEVAEILATYIDQRDDQDRAMVVRNGHHPEREIQMGIGPVTVQVPKVRSRRGEPVTFRSALVPPYVRKTANLEDAIPRLPLKDISMGEMQAALEALVGPEAKGLSASKVARLKHTWREEYEICPQRLVDDEPWVSIWVDGIYSGLRAEHHRLCALVVIDVNTRGEKRFLAIEDGIRESTQSWGELLLGLKARGMTAPQLAVGDGVLGGRGGNLPEHTAVTVLVQQDPQCLEWLAKECSAQSETDVAGDLAGRDQSGRGTGLRRLSGNL